MSTIENVQDQTPSQFDDLKDVEEAILAKWEDAEETQPSEEEAEATSDEEEALDSPDDFEEEAEPDEEDEVDDDADPDDEETTDDQDEDDAEEDEDSEEEPQLMSDDAEVEITVDGVTQRVSVASLKRLHGQEQALTRKSQQTAAQRKEAEAAMEKSHHIMQAMLQRAEARWKPYSEVDFLLASKQMEADEFAALRKEAHEAQQDLNFLTEEANKFYDDIKAQQQTAMQEAAKQCVKTLQEEIPEWSNQLYNDIRSYAVNVGLPQDQVDQYVDPVVIQLIHKARLYDESKKIATVKKKAATKKKVLRSQKAPDPEASKKAKAAKARQRMIQNGGNDLDDIAAAILGRWEA